MESLGTGTTGATSAEDCAEGSAATPDGAELRWWSRGRGPVLLLIPGQASTHRGWLPLVPRLAQHHRVVLYDHRGIGRSTSGTLQEWTTRSFARDGSLSARRRRYRASRTHDAWESLGGLTAPVLILHGGADRVTPASHARLLAERIPQAQLLIEPDQLHCPHLESEQVRDRVEQFLLPVA